MVTQDTCFDRLQWRTCSPPCSLPPRTTTAQFRVLRPSEPRSAPDTGLGSGGPSGSPCGGSVPGPPFLWKSFPRISERSFPRHPTRCVQTRLSGQAARRAANFERQERRARTRTEKGNKQLWVELHPFVSPFFIPRFRHELRRLNFRSHGGSPAAPAAAQAPRSSGGSSAVPHRGHTSAGS
jgi:hypothetical protein